MITQKAVVIALIAMRRLLLFILFIASRQSAKATASSSMLHRQQIQQSSLSYPTITRINCGATNRIPVVTDQNISWSRDHYYQSGAISNRCYRPNGMNHNNNHNQSIYCTSRYFRSTTYGASLRYDIPVPYNEASYSLRLHFNEQYHDKIGERIFDVLVEEDTLVLNDFDILRTAGQNVPFIISIPTTIYITDGTMTIDFVENVGDPQINGIEIIYRNRNTPAPTKKPSPTTAPSKSPKTTNIPEPVSASPGNAPTQRPTTNRPTAFPLTSLHVPMVTPVPSVFTKTPTKLPMTNVTFPNIVVPVANNSLTKPPVRQPTLAPTTFPSQVPIAVATPNVVIQPLNATRPPIFFISNAPMQAPDISPSTTKRPTTNTSNITALVPMSAPVAQNNNNNITTTPVPVQRPNVVPAVNVGNIIHRINCGSTNQVVVPPNHVVWSPDHYVTNGRAYNTCGNNQSISTTMNNTTNITTSSIYCTSRYFRTVDVTPYRYELPIPVSNRSYPIRLHFAEQYHTRPNDRIFDVFVEGVLVIDHLDLMAIPGGNISYIVMVNAFVSDGNMTIDFVRVKGNPLINGIEVFDDGHPIPLPTVAPEAVVQPPTDAPFSIPLPPILTNTSTVPVSTPLNSSTTGSSNSTTFQDIAINCGGPQYMEQSGLRQWSSDSFFLGGKTYSSTNIQILNTVDDEIYQSERVGTFSYSIPVPVGTYEINVHLAELTYAGANKRKFNLTIESQAFDNVDIFALAGGSAKAVSLGATVIVDDGFASIAVAKVLNSPKLNGIEIKLSVPHVAHSVSNGPYFFVDASNDGVATVTVDGSESHTHGSDLTLTRWIWKKGAEILGTEPVSSFPLPVGAHDITLTVFDSGNFQATDATTVTVYPYGFPSITTLTPTSGSIVGGERVTIRGTGFTFSAAETIVNFGVEQLTGSAIQVVNSTTITVLSPQIPISVPVLVSIETPLGWSKDATFTYVSSTPISFSTTKLLDFNQPTSVEFGPDGKLYVGSSKGTLSKITLTDNYASFVSVVSAVVQPDRAILGIAFDPLDAGNPLPYVYISSSLLFHKETNSSFGKAISGKISRVRGANLDVVEDIVTGLPVCDNDHAVNQIQFGHHGELYINIGSNTNGGVPGSISGSRRLKESYFSASILMADLSHPLFDGFIEYDADDDGSPINYFGISVFAPGLRNPFGLTMHSNGNLYATDNGPNTGYGKMKVGCDPSALLADQQREDKLVQVRPNKYYGHPNPKRATYQNDTRQCVWRDPTTEGTSTDNYQAPMGVLLSSAGGMIEYQAEHFNGQLRGNLIHAKYKGGLLRTVLSADGVTANPLTIPGLLLLGRDGLDVAQAPNGNLVEARYLSNAIYMSQPIETSTAAIRVGSVFPTRGGLAGGTLLRVYGLNFGTVATSVTVTVGNSNCPVVGVVTNTFLQCTLPGRPAGMYDIVVTTADSGAFTFKLGYRYIQYERHRP